MNAPEQPPAVTASGDETFAQLRASLARAAATLDDGAARTALASLRHASGAVLADLYAIDAASASGGLVRVVSAGAPGWSPAGDLVDEAFHSAGPIWLRSRDELIARIPEAEPDRTALLAFPLYLDGRPVGAVALHYGPVADDADIGRDELADLAGGVGAAELETLRIRYVGARRAEAMSQLFALTDALAAAPDTMRAAAVLARAGAALVGATAGLVYLTEADELVLRGDSGVSTRDLRALRVLPCGGDTPYAEAARSGRPLYVPSRGTFERRYAGLAHPHVMGESLAVVPLTAGSDTVGVIAFGFAAPRTVGAVGTDLLLMVARQAAQTLARLRLAEEQRQNIEFERRFQEFTAPLSAASTPEEVARIAVTRTLPVFGASAAVLTLADADRRSLIVHDLDGPLATHISAAAGGAVGHPHPLLDAFRSAEPLLLSGRAAVRERYPALLEPNGDGLQSLAAVPLRTAGRPFGALLLTFSRRHVFTETERAGLRRLAERTADALVRGRLLVAEQTARRRSELLHEMASALNEKSDARGVAHTLLGRVVPAVGATSATVALADGDHYRPVATAAGGGGRRDRWSATEAALARRAVAAGRAVVAVAGNGDPGLSTIVPLTAGGLPLGVLMVTIPGPPVAVDVVDMLTTVGQLAGAALERAIAYERDHRVAEELQQSLLGRRTSPLASLTANAGYRPGNAGLRVGGDWHDIMSLPGGRLLVTVGDVVGSGLPAAAAMGQLRSAMSALARVVEDPGRLLEHLSSFAEGVEAAQYATVCVAIVDPETGEVRYASAGHPPPLVVQRDGSGAYLWQGRSEPLACGTGRRAEALAVLPDGGSLVLYTDGLVERRQELIDDGLERLRRTVGRLIADETPDLPERILDAALDEDVRHDDAVVLVATIGTVPVRVFHHELPKDAAALAPMRQALRMWLTSVDADQPTAHDLVLVVNEAAANAVEHGEGNDDVPIRIRVAFDPRKRVFEGAITGAGRWREQRPTDRGRGLPIIRNLTDGVTLERRRGTTLTFRRTLRGASAEHAGRG